MLGRNGGDFEKYLVLSEEAKADLCWWIKSWIHQKEKSFSGQTGYDDLFRRFSLVGEQCATDHSSRAVVNRGRVATY
jgi:hypothetical protein